MKLKKGHFALVAGLFACLLWGSQAFVAVEAASRLNFLEITILLHVFALLGVSALNFCRLGDFIKDLRFIFSVRPAFGFWLLSGACQAVCLLLFYLSVQNGPQIPGMTMHFMWPFVFAVSNAVFPSTWEQRSRGYELKVVALGIAGILFLTLGGAAVGEHSGIALGLWPLMFAGLASTVFGCFNASCDYHALARSRAKRVNDLKSGALSVSFRYSALQLRFLAGFAATMLLWALQPCIPLLPAVDFGTLDAARLLPPLWLGLVVYFGADFFFGYTMTHISDSARQGFTYLPPLFGALLLYFGGAHVDQQMIFGLLIILFSMFQLQAGTRAWTANTAAPLLFIFSSIIVLHVPDMLKAAGLMGDGNGINAEVMAGVFAIVISFLLSRLLDRNKSENVLQIENAALMGEILTEASKTLKDEGALSKVKNMAYQLSVYILDFDVNTSEVRREPLIEKISAVAAGLGKSIAEAVPETPPEIKSRLDALSGNVLKWIYMRSQFLSKSEKWSVVLLSFASIIAFLIATNRSPIWYADLSAIALITTVFILVFQAFDLGANRSETEAADILNKQMPLLRHGFLPYVPFELIRQRVFVSEGKPMDVLTRRPEGHYERARLQVREKDIRFLEQLLNTAGLVAILLLLLQKHGLVHLW